MDKSSINLLITTFPGLNLPKTLSLQIPASSSISESLSYVEEKLPSDLHSRLSVTTNTNRHLLHSSAAPISSLLSAPSDDFLSLRLSAPLCGGKGGFGSQLRAAGGRMSSRKKKNQGDTNGSSRNLDGRRLRTVKEAKALAEYLAVKPDMDKREKEERMKRWEQVVEMAEKKQESLNAGGKARLNSKWMEAKDEASEKTREAVLAALTAGEIHDVFMDSDDSDGSEDDDGSESEEQETETAQKGESSKSQARSFFGWEEEELSESDDDGEASNKKED